jgi:MinD superfamily P-loop ATPase
MDRVSRTIVRIDQDLCNGCGLCVTPCAEGAIERVNGKAHVVSDELCDGAGFCLAVCPTGALSVETREAAPFNEAAAHAREKARGLLYIEQTCFRCGSGEQKAVLLPVRTEGQSLWVCTQCLPTLIHG